MTIAICSVLLGVLLGQVIPSGVKPGVKYRPLDEDDFQQMLRTRGLG